jgi:hypothetical protein
MLSSVLAEPDDAWRVALAAHELVENAFRHSIDGEVSVALDVTGEGDKHLLTIRIRNRATPEQLEILKTHLDELATAADALDHYLEVMRRSAHRESGLGLARVRAEAEMTVSGAFEGDEVCILASTPVRLHPPGTALMAGNGGAEA